MSNHIKTYTDYSAFLEASNRMSKYQRIHNIIRKDYQTLLTITEKHKLLENEFDALYRSCLKGLFSMIEADIYGLNELDAYDHYKDKDTFEDKFKKTFKQVGRTWNKADRVQQFLDTKWKDLFELRKLRDQLIHPKEFEHMHKASASSFERVRSVFSDYDNFINDLMNDFFIEITIPTSFPK